MVFAVLIASRWASKLKGSHFEEAMNHFCNIKIDEKAKETGAHVVADRIRAAVLDHFTSSLGDRLSPTSHHPWSKTQKGGRFGDYPGHDVHMEDGDRPLPNDQSRDGDHLSPCTSLGTDGRGDSGE